MIRTKREGASDGGAAFGKISGLASGQSVEDGMPNRILTAHELMKANKLLTSVRRRLDILSAGDRSLRFAYNRKIAKELMYDERGKPSVRKDAKRKKWEEQGRKCAECGKELALTYSVADRREAVDGYAADNFRLIHQDCDYEAQAAKQYS
jgi:hypothetical protein